MKKVIFLMLALTAGYFGASAQGDDKSAPSNDQAHMKLTPEQRAKQAADKLNSTVQLTPDQYSKVLEINKDFFAKREALRANAKQGDEDSRNQFRALAKEREDKIMGLLTPEQQKKEKEAREMQRQNGRTGGHE